MTTHFYSLIAFRCWRTNYMHDWLFVGRSSARPNLGSCLLHVAIIIKNILFLILSFLLPDVLQVLSNCNQEFIFLILTFCCLLFPRYLAFSYGLSVVANQQLLERENLGITKPKLKSYPAAVVVMLHCMSTTICRICGAYHFTRSTCTTLIVQCCPADLHIWAICAIIELLQPFIWPIYIITL
jgi:hypothetical protein